MSGTGRRQYRGGCQEKNKGMIDGKCPGKSSVNGGEEISTKDRGESHELRLNLIDMVVTAELVQTGELGEGHG